MTVIFAEDISPAIRGLLRRWFVEPCPNVFVGSINSRTREKTISYIRRNGPSIRLLIVSDADNCQGFNIMSYGYPSRRPAMRCGLELIVENPDDLSGECEKA